MKSLDKSFYHNIQLSSVRMISLKSNINLNCNDNNVDVKISLDNYSEIISQRIGKCFLKTKIKGFVNEKSDEEIFDIEVIYEGVCEGTIPIEEDEFSFFLDIQAVPMLWSFSRESINTCMHKMGLPPILLPVLNISQLIEATIKGDSISNGENMDE